ncbi:hypothetical protein MGLY_00510 [Neomoorella glycerini]|uniref:Uncharacterized protein n=1 Tax=Neomoorella glycerini TaxID=55779 RepID=A0A6I5ZM82_9FIRM|nr:hypothetical protein [Moorella glycerini]QGP90741.1 hypothetical protein MGLY_00510 [Moorella glycerini]
MALSDVELTVNLYTEGDKFFDLLKAAVRDWQGGWGHERERAAYALELYQRSLQTMRAHLEEARAKAEGGFFTDQDQRILNRTEEKLAYWEKKLAEIRK